MSADTQPEVFFSIVVPVLNREGMIRRAVDSCLRQDFDSFEVIVVDDGSTDDTATIVESYADPRVRLVRHARNKGVCAARNTAIDHARGAWCVMLDSDFELLPGALTGLHALCTQCPDDVGNVATLCTWDHGGESPRPAPIEDLTLDYPSYLRFVSGLTVSEWFNCIRRTVFDAVRFPSKRAYEASFHLGLAKRFRFQLYRQRYVRIHTDATNRVTIAPPAYAAQRMLRDAADSAADVEGLLVDHGEAFRTYAPKLYAQNKAVVALHHFLAGHRTAALKTLAPIARTVARSPGQMATVVLGMVGPLPLAWAKAHWTWARRSAP